MSLECMKRHECISCMRRFPTDDQLKEVSREELEQLATCAINTSRQLDQIIEASYDTLFVTDGEGNVLRVNEAYEKLVGVSRSQLVGVNVKDLEGDVISRSATLEAIRLGKTVTIVQDVLKNHSTGYVTSRPIFKNGKIEMVVSNNRNFDELETLKLELETEREKVQKYITELEYIRKEYLIPNDLVARDKRALEVLYRARKVASFDSNVLITGETGTGKEQYAKFIHNASHRKNAPFVRVNCGAITPTIIESELFGYEKGSFTGASTSGKKGLFEIADQGTIFLDEIGELPYEMQVKLLRVIQEQELVRVGGTQPVKINVRVLAATNRNLKEMVQNKQFREDLYYRLNVVTIEVPPLRERPDDIVPLVMHFMQELNQRYHMNKRVSRGAYTLLRAYSWPGNIRELKNILEEAAVMSESDVLEKEDFLLGAEPPHVDKSVLKSGKPLNMILEETEYHYLRSALSEYGSMRKAAAGLGLSATTYIRRLKKLEELYGRGTASDVEQTV